METIRQKLRFFLADHGVENAEVVGSDITSDLVWEAGPGLWGFAHIEEEEGVVEVCEAPEEVWQTGFHTLGRFRI